MAGSATLPGVTAVHHSSRAKTNSAPAQDKFLFFISSSYQVSAGFVRRIGAQAAGQTTHRNAKGVCTVPDYKAMYFELFRASVQAVQLLQDAQTRAEQQLLAADLPPLRLDETEKSDS